MIMFEGQIMTPLDINHFKQLLLHLRDEILQSEHSGKEEVQPVELDQTTVGRVSRMDALQGQAMAKASQQRRHIQLQRIQTALRRIENGEFGWCHRCSEPIAPKRLDFDPTAPLCIDCANSGTT
jgi:DnaK suppressor protein